MKWLVDTNVLSALTAREPDPNVVRWTRQREPDLVLSPIVVGEFRYGVLNHPDAAEQARLMEWYAEHRFGFSVANVDIDVAERWAVLRERLRDPRRSAHIADRLIAATALAIGGGVATRNVRDFRGCGAPVVDPFLPEGGG